MTPANMNTLEGISLADVEQRIAASVVPGGDIYIAKASRMFGVRLEDVTPEQRRLAKAEHTRLAYSGRPVMWSGSHD